MALRFSTGLRNHLLNSIGNSASGVSFDGGTLSIYTGSQPSTADAAPIGTLLVEVTLPADAFAVASNGIMAKSGTWQATAVAAGTAGWFRLARAGDSGGSSSTDIRIDGAVTAVGGGGELQVDNPSLAAGQQFTVGTFSISFPAEG